MDYKDLRRDRDFKKAVRYIAEDVARYVAEDVARGIVQNCTVYVDDDYGYISC